MGEGGGDGDAIGRGGWRGSARSREQLRPALARASAPSCHLHTHASRPSGLLVIVLIASFGLL